MLVRGHHLRFDHFGEGSLSSAVGGSSGQPRVLPSYQLGISCTSCFECHSLLPSVDEREVDPALTGAFSVVLLVRTTFPYLL